MPPKMIVNLMGFALVLGALLFLPVGTLAWPQAWVFMAQFIGCSEATGVWLARTDPDLLVARSASPLSADQKPRDRMIVIGILVGMALWVAFMGLDARRFGWSSTPYWAQGLGALLILSVFAGWVWVLRANSFAATTIRVQAERGQRVISTGPYAIVRHPMYAFALGLMVGAPLLLGSLWGLLGGVLMAPLLAARAHGEEAMLMEGHAGYRDYAAKVRFRMFPGVW